MALPCDDQSVQSIYAWAQNLKIGDEVCIRQSRSHIFFEYKLARVEDFGRQGNRVAVEGHGSFHRSKDSAGKNCNQPKGQVSMIEPTQGVREACVSGATYRE